MRLIDADKLELNAEWDDYYDGFTAYSEFSIDNAPTIEAIPVEWIKKFVNERAANDGPDGWWHFWGEDVLMMITQWEKENEIS